MSILAMIARFYARNLAGAKLVYVPAETDSWEYERWIIRERERNDAIWAGHN